ncbi:MAG: GTP 3',8-cyclase MoaA [Methanocorpusculum sp.]|nr:GTP 3',8-cyclase MoaA [Methanocorpusculum sp.]
MIPVDADTIMTDSFGRRITDIRLVLTSACNLRCIYCHHEGEEVNGCVRADRSYTMSKDEIIEVLNALAPLGIRTLKLTGGEPTLRPDLIDIIRAVPEGIEVSMTTNGTRLREMAKDLKAAGLARVNISIDTLKRGRYEKITGRDLLPEVLDGLNAAVEAGLTPVKINTVLLPGMNDDEIDDFLALVRGRDDLILQFIELMDINGWADGMDNSIHQYAAFVSDLEAKFANASKQIVTRRMHHRRKYNLDGAVVEIVRPMHNAEFCANCNRLRITSDGLLKPCLLKTGNEVSIRGLHGEELQNAIAEAVHRRTPYFRKGGVHYE